jgi:DNA-binding SARP family transcriptional activator
VLLRRERPFCGVAPVPVIRAEADRLEDDWLSAVEKRAGLDLAAGRSAEIVGELARAAELHPYRERLAEQLMLALYRSGRQTEALAAYRRITAALAADLMVKPGPRLIDLHRAILCQRPELITSS